jgi:glycosyltransferase involved in cell wall biosynthesis/peptidoglycan/xylan/chitin deacetylase (PgdA/CDA1 family)
MRVLLLTNEYPNPYQPDKAVFNRHLVRALGRTEDIVVVSPISWVDEWQARRRAGNLLGPDRCARHEGIEVCYPRYYYPPKMLRARYDWFYWRSVRAVVREVLASHRPEIVLSYWAHPDGAVALRAAREAGLPCAVMVGGSDVLQLTRSAPRRRRIAAVLQEADAVVAVSQDIKAQLAQLGVSEHEVHVVHRGVDSVLFSPGDRSAARARLGLPPDSSILVWVGRMVPVKGLEVLLEACSHLRERGQQFLLCLIGDGPLRARLQAQVEARNLTGQVRFVGPAQQEQLAAWYRAANLSVLPSHSEGIPNVLRESLACGTPFVASRVGGIPEIADSGSCRLVPPGDPAALSQALEASLCNPVPLHASTTAPASWQESAERLMQVLRPLTVSRAAVRSPRLIEPVVDTRTELRHRTGASGWRQLVRRAMQAVLPRRLVLVRGPRISAAVCLTFDDGPHPEHTPRLLDVLKKHDLRATFFVIGERAARHPEIIQRMAAEGHVVGHHSYYHRPPGETSAEALLEEVKQSRALLGRLLGEPPDCFRPPQGKVTATKLWQLWRAGQTVVLWNQDPRDFACPDVVALQHWFDGCQLKGGDVVLLHDNQPHAAAVVPSLAQAVRGQQLEFATITEWLS